MTTSDGPVWNQPGRQRVTPKKRNQGNPRIPRGRQRKCGCGCGELAGYHPDNNGDPNHVGKPRRFIPGHQVSKMRLENVKIEREMAAEMAEQAAREEAEAFLAELDELFAEASELGLTGDALIAHVYSDSMEQRAVRAQVIRAVKDGNKEAANWLHSRKHGTAKGSATKKTTSASDNDLGFLDPSEIVDEGDWVDD